MFAKIFQLTPEAQVLLIKGDPDDEVGEYRLVFITEIKGFRCNMRIIFQTKSGVDAAFDRYNEDAAQAFYDKMLQQLQ